MRKILPQITATLLLLMVSEVAFAAGFIVIGKIEVEPPRIILPRPIPHPRPVPYNQPIFIKSQQIGVAIKSQIAVTTVEQVFHNPNPRQLEGTFIFPLRDEAAINSFSLWMGGKEVRGELLEAAKARGIYENIVRRLKDPGLLEYMGTRMFRCRVFPIPANGDCRIRLSYSQALKNDAGLTAYTYPLKFAPTPASPPPPIPVRGDGVRYRERRFPQPPGIQGQMVISVDLQDQREILNVYSPTHTIDVVRKSARHLKISFENKGRKRDRDFKLFYNVSMKAVGLSLIPFRPAGEDGYFMAILTPRDTTNQKDIIPKDIVFVLDRSSSMLDNGKIQQAQAALKFCLASLNRHDNFGIVAFATEAETYAATLLPATKENVQKAIHYVDKKIIARGGTAIDEALRVALKLNLNRERPFMLVFLTDGEPTIGERDPQAIIKNTKAAAAPNVRLFTFGLGYNVNSSLLDTLAGASRGYSTYVSPRENIEVKVGAFYAKVASPVLTDATVEFVGLDTYDVYPKKIGDIFRDQQVVLVGRYRGSGTRAIKLKGKFGRANKEIVYECTFPEKETSNDFLPRIWAMRKVGYLLEEIRQRGETAEVRNEIVRLSKRHGIMTPYTSWLVIEDYKRRPSPGRGPAQPEPAVQVLQETAAGRAGGFRKGPNVLANPTAAEAEDSIVFKDHAKGLRDAGTGGLRFGERQGFLKKEKEAREMLAKESPSDPAAKRARKAARDLILNGKSAASPSRRELIEDEDLDAEGVYRFKDRRTGAARLKHIGGRTFYRIGAKWIDAEYKSGDTTLKVIYFSAEYFKLLREKPELAKFFALGEQLIVKYAGAFYEVVEK